MRGIPEKDATPFAAYSARSEAESNLTKQVHRAYSDGHQILTKPWNELNNQSVLDDMDMGRKMFNAFVDDSDSDVAMSWRWKGTRSKARNKAIAMHANLTAGFLFPTFHAQNEDNEMDRGFSEFMTDLVEWMAQDENSDYKYNFMSLVFAMETDPIVYLGAEYQEVMQTIKVKGEDNRYSKKEILDEVLSGFKAPIYTADQILVTNAFERNLQKHGWVLKRKWIEYQEAEAKYGTNQNWDFVHAGQNTVYNQDDGLFYEIKDDEHPSLVEEVTAMNRREDIEICFLGGIPMYEGEIEDSRMKHRDNFDAPRYNIQQFGFYSIGSHFLYYRSMMSTMRWDNALYDAMTEIAMNRAILDAEMPIAVTGSDKIDQDIVFPNAVIAMKDANTKVTPLLPASNLNNIFNALNETERSLSEASVNETTQGQLPAASQKAYSVAQAQANAKKIIGGVAKNLASSVSRYGLLMKDIAVNNLTTAEVQEIVGDTTKLKYGSFILKNKEVGGKRMDKMLTFDENLIGKEMSEDDKRRTELHLYGESEKRDMGLYIANPELFAKFKYLSRSDYREVFAQNDEQMQAVLLALEAQMRENPYANQEALTRELMYSYFHSRGDKFTKKPEQMQPIQEDLSGLSKQNSQATTSKMLAGSQVNAGVR